MTTALIVYDEEDGTTFYVTENPERIAIAAKFCGKFIGEVGMSEEDDEELSSLITDLNDDACAVSVPHKGDLINEVYWVGCCS